MCRWLTKHVGMVYLLEVSHFLMRKLLWITDDESLHSDTAYFQYLVFYADFIADKLPLCAWL